MAKEHLEQESKLEAGVGVVVPPLADVWPGVDLTVRPPARLSAVYFDTADLRLMRAGVTLRHRHERDGESRPVSEWTLKLPGLDGSTKQGALTVRRELTWLGSAQSLPPEAASLVRGLRRSSPLGPVARLVTVRKTVELRGEEGAKLAEVDDDVVSVMEGRRLAARFREIEVELGDDPPAGLLDAIVARLQDAGAVASDGRSKVVRAIGARAVEAPEVRRLPLDLGAPLDQVVRAAIVEGYLRLVAHDAGVRLDEDSEDVHQARVATRRLRSDLRTFRSVLDSDWLAEIRGELGWLAAALGEVRDADVLSERLADHITVLGADASGPAGGVLDRIVAERQDAWARLMEVLESERYVTLLDRLAEAAQAPPWSVAAASDSVADSARVPESDHPEAEGLSTPAKLAKPARKLAGSFVVRPWRHLAKAVDELPADPSDDALHEIRIRAKRLRYACEAVTEVAAGPAAELAKAAAGLQGVLGDFHDAVVAEQWLHRAGLQGTVSEALVAGQLIGLERQAAEAGRQQWRSAWEAVDKKRLRGWLT